MLLSSSVETSVAFEQVLERVGAIAQHLHQCHDIDAMLAYSVREIQELFGSDRALVYQFLPTGDGVVTAEAVGENWQPIIGQLIYDPCFQRQWAEPYRQGRVQAIADVEQSELATCHIEFLTRLQVKANLVVPVIVPPIPAVSVRGEPQLWGLLIVQQCDRPRPWSALQIQVLKQMAAQIALAMKHWETITEYRQLEATYQTLEQKYQTLFHLLPVGVLVTDADGRLVEINPASEAILGVSTSEHLRQPVDVACWPLIHPNGSPMQASDCAWNQAREGQGLSVETGIVQPSGEVRWSAVRAAPIPLDGYGVAIAALDTTDLKWAERQLQWQTAALNACADVIVITDRQGIIEWVNPAFVTLTGYSPAEAIGKNPRELVKSGVQNARFYRQMWTCILSGQVWRGELVNRRKDGHLYYEEMTITPIHNQHHEITHFIAIKQDITERKRLEHLQHQQVRSLNLSLEAQVQERTTQLEQSLHFEMLLKRITDKVRDSLDEQQILQTVVEELAHGLAIAACDTGIYDLEQSRSTITYEFTVSLTASQGCTFAIADAPHREVYPFLFEGQMCQFCDMVPNPLRSSDQLLTVLACPIQDATHILGDLWLFKSSDQVFNDLEMRLVQQVANHCAIALRQSRLYQTAQAQVCELERLNQLKDDFLSTVSHELRTPMANIKMATQMLEMHLQALGLLAHPAHPVQRYFSILQEEEHREINLINDLLDLTRLDAGTEPLSITEADLWFWLPHIAEPFLERTRHHQQTLEIDIPPGLPPVMTDLTYLERCVTELLNNACKYTPAGETIRLWVEAEDTGFRLSVSNSGVEIPESERDRIFEKFYRIPNHDPWKHSGTGLGLALVQRMVQQLGGYITVDSGPHQITTFTLHLLSNPLAR